MSEDSMNLQAKNGNAKPSSPANPYDDEPLFEEILEEKIDQLIEEAKIFNASYQDFKKKEFFSHEHVFLISTKWLRRWKRYVSFDEVNSGKQYHKLIGCGTLPQVNQDIVDLSQKFTLQFDQKSDKHMNTKLKIDLSEGVDFQYLDENTWNIIYDNYEYNGFPIQRKIVDSPDGKIVELHYQRIALVPIMIDILKDIEHQSITKLTEVTVQFSKYATVDEFIKIAGKVLKKWMERKSMIYVASQDYLKLWKMPQKWRKPILLNTLLQGCKANPSFTYKLFMEGDLIEKDKQIGELNIVKDTIIVAEVRQSRDSYWIFYNLKHKLKASCSGCKKQKELNFVCSCKHAVYCSKECKSSDKSQHKWRCPNEALSDEEEKQLEATPESRHGLTGLRNLGNTCFMNSGLQCLSHIPQLTSYFLSKKYLKDINVNNPLGTHGQLSTQYAKMIINLWLGEESSFSPHLLKKSIGKFQPMFSGYNQHDSGELITYLLDGLHEDLNRVIHKPYTQTKDYDGRPDIQIAKQAWETFLKRNQSIVVDLMYGQYKSKVQCPNQACKNISITFDPFAVCSLPLINKTKKRLEFTFIKEYIYSNKVNLTYSMDKQYTLNEKMNELKQLVGVDQDKRLIIYVSSYSSCEVVKTSELLSDIKSEYSYKTLYVRELNSYENPQADIKVNLVNAVNNKYHSGELYRRNISPYHLFFINPNKTNKQVYHQLIGYYAKITKQTFDSIEQFYNKFIDVLEKDQLFRILLIPFSRYYTCNYCGKKSCEGCKLPYTDELFSDYVKFNPSNDFDKEKKVEIELYWRQDEKEIEKLFDEIKEANQSFLSKGSEKSIASKPDAVSIYDCLKLFEKEEILNEQNTWYCPKCKDFVLAKKQMKIYKAPQILTLCLKRFKRKGYFSEKIGSLVDFPIEGLDLTDFVVNQELPEGYFKSEAAMEIEGLRVLYDLIGVSNHFGSTGGGHYTAYCKDPKSGDWYDFDDSYVSKLKSNEDVVTESSYILFYKRRL